MDEIQILAREESEHGEWVLRLRKISKPHLNRVIDVYEIISDGRFVMDTEEASTEALLADVAIERAASPKSVLVAGLGFGFTLRRTLEHAFVQRVDVVEIEPRVVRWLRGPLAAVLGCGLEDPRVQVEVKDFSDHVRCTKQLYDVVLLDVDNGPEFLLLESNDKIYEVDGLRALRSVLNPGGVVAVWSSEPSPSLLSNLEQVFESSDEVVQSVTRGRRTIDYHIFIARA